MDTKETKKPFYVYLHRAIETNTPFYVGSGSGERCYSAQGRSADWRSKAENGFLVSIHSTHETRAEAYVAEFSLIKDLGLSILVNKVVSQTIRKEGKHNGEKSDRERVIRKPVLCVEAGKVFDSCAQAARWIAETKNKPKAHRVSINDAVRGHAMAAYGYTWRYA